MEDIYLCKLSDRLSSFFDISSPCSLSDCQFDMKAVYRERDSRYMLLKSAEIYAVKSYEYIFYKRIYENFGQEHIDIINKILRKDIHSIVELSDEHMSSVVTFIFSSDKNPDEKVIKAIKKFNFHKSFMFGLKGWANCKLMVVNSLTNDIYTNKLAKGDSSKFIFK